MILEGIIAKNLLQKETEKFSEKKEPNTWFAVAFLILIFTYTIALLILWIRVVVKAFSCGIKSGLASVLTPGLYAMYVFADTITVTCAAA